MSDPAGPPDDDPGGTPGETQVTPASPPWAGLGEGAAALAIGGLAMHLLGAGGYRSGFFGVFLPLAAVSGGLVWLRRDREADRLTWVAVSVVLAAVIGGLLVGSAPLSRNRLLAEARAQVPPFFDEIDASTSGHSWCRPTCPVATLVLKPPNTGNPAIMLDLATRLLPSGALDGRRLAQISRDTSFRSGNDRIGYEVELEGTGNDRTVTLTLRSR